MSRLKSYLFRIKAKLYWCHNCNIPILTSTCPLCGSPGILINTAPPSDVRPAWNYSINLIRKTIDRDYGDGIGWKLLPNGKPVLLNRVPGVDWIDEVIVDGVVIGALIFDPAECKWKFMPKLEGARRIHIHGGGKWIKVDWGAARQVIKKMNVLSVGVLAGDPSIERGDYVYILNPNGEVIAIGRARGNWSEIAGGKTSIAVRTKQAGEPREPIILNRKASWSQVVKANREHLKSKVSKTLNFIIKATTCSDSPLVIALSGGKDSACILGLIVEELNWKAKVVFLDGGLEFPETVKYVEELIDHYNLNDSYIHEKAEDDFWKIAEAKGPPSRDYRWCCEVCKLKPMRKVVKKLGGKCRTLIGQRKYESISRANQPKITPTIRVPGQVKIAPIMDWTALEVWLYLLSRHIPINPLYHQGHHRIGCYMCPSSDLAELQLVKKTHPKLWSEWESFLRKWAEKKGYSWKWLKYGLWRWRKTPSYMEKIVSEGAS